MPPSTSTVPTIAPAPRMPRSSRTMECLAVEPRPPSCGASHPAHVGFPTVRALFRTSLQPDAGVGDDLLPDLGLASDVGCRLSLRAGDRLHALLGVRSEEHTSELQSH